MFNVVTSLARFDNASKLIEHLEPHGIRWHVIMDDDRGCSLKFDAPWIQTYICPNSHLQFWARCHGALNWFLETQDIRDDEMYCFMNDDDGYEPDFFAKVEDAMQQVQQQHGQDPDVVIVSMQRGDNIPIVEPHRIAHGTSYLLAHPDNVRVGCIGMEQFLVRGRIARQYRFPIEVAGDGMYIESIYQEHGAAFVPWANAWFNYFEPGRWNK